MQPYPLQVQNAYADLLARHLARRLPRIQGSLWKRKTAKRSYWEARRRFGTKQKTSYIGPDTAETRTLVEELRVEQDVDKKFQRDAGALVQMIAKARAPTPGQKTGSVLRALANAGAFRLGAVLIGTHAFRIYEVMLGVRLGAEGMATEDIDIAHDRELQVAAGSGPDPRILDVLASLKLSPQFSMSTPEGVWQWASDDGSLLVEFLTPEKYSRNSDAKLVDLEALGIKAMQLKFLEFLLKDPIDAVALYREGVLIKVPNPARYAVHKLIVSTRRSSSQIVKVAKDRKQAEALLEILLEAQPFEVAEIWEEARSSGKSWVKMLEFAAKRLPVAIQEQMREIGILE